MGEEEDKAVKVAVDKEKDVVTTCKYSKNYLMNLLKFCMLLHC